MGFDFIQRGENAFAEIKDNFPELYAEWWPRFERLATAFVVWEEARLMSCPSNTRPDGVTAHV